MFKRTILILCLLVLLSASISAAQDTGSTPINVDTLIAQAQAEGEISVIVGLAAGTQGIELPPEAVMAQQESIQSARASVISSLAAYGVDIIEPSTEWQIPYVALRVNAEALAALAANPLVTSIDPNQSFYSMLSSTIPVVNADDAWSQGYTGSGQAIVIIDSGVERTHGFFGGRVVAEACYSGAGATSSALCPNGATTQTGTGASDPSVKCVPAGYTDCNHGTHVAGIAAGSSDSIAGVGRGASIISIMTASHNPGSTRVQHFISDIVSALNHAYNLRMTYSIAAVNMSLGGGGYSNFCDGSFGSIQAAVLNLRGARIPTVIATGNNGYANLISAPACVSAAISVGATTNADAIASFSNRHPMMTVFAPGVNVYSSVLGGTYGTMSGTSMATPHVAGAAAVLKQAKPSMTVSEFKYALENTGPGIAIAGATERRLDVLAALNYVRNQMVVNNEFSSGAANWSVYPPSTLTTRVQNGVYEFYRNAATPTTSVLQHTGIAVPTVGTRFEVHARLGNTSGQPQRVSILAYDADFSDVQICSFWLPPGAPMREYMMQFRNSDPWSNAAIAFYPADAGSSFAWLQVDEVTMTTVTGTWNYTYCKDPIAPGPTGTNSADLLTNGNFALPVPQPNGSPVDNWWTYGQISWEQIGGVFHFNRTAGAPPGVVAQSSGDAAIQNTLFEANFQIGNSSTLRGQMTVIIHDLDFTDMNVCTFWIPPGTTLQSHTMLMYARKPWANATIAFYPRTILPNGAFQIDNVTLQTRSIGALGTECYPYDLGVLIGSERVDGSVYTAADPGLSGEVIIPTVEIHTEPILPPGELPIIATPVPFDSSAGQPSGEGQLFEEGLGG